MRESHKIQDAYGLGGINFTPRADGVGSASTGLYKSVFRSKGQFEYSWHYNKSVI